MIRLDIFSDPVCPWCFIGKALLDRALERSPEHPFAIHWHPFQLNPDMPRDGMDRRAYLEAKFGGKAEAAKVYTQIAQAAQGAGVELNLSAIERQPNTLDAHRLIHWAGLEGRQAAVVSALFRTYFREGRDIGHHEVLVEIAEKAGMEREMVARLLSTDSDVAETRTRDAHARARGVNAVPTFVVGDTYVLPGAQPVELWERAIAEIAGQQSPDSGA